MKKSLLGFLSVLPALSFAQWSTTGNTGASGQWLGTNNAFALSIKTNNTERLNISSAGVFKFVPLTGSGNGLMLLSNDGTASRLNLSGTSTQVLNGAGSFVGIGSLAGWSVSGTNTLTSNKVGIGITSPTNALEVSGNGVFSGFVAAQQFIVADIATVQGRLSLTNNVLMDGYDPIAGTRNEVWTVNQPYFIQSAPGYNNNLILNSGNSGRVGIGTEAPNAKLDINGTMRVNGKARFYRITSLEGDTVVRFGDSTIYMNTTTNCIYGSPTGTTLGYNKGIGLGSFCANGHGLYSVAIGYQSQAQVDYSWSMGYFVKSNAAKSITIGSGKPGNYLVNNNSNSLMVGFNSTLPSFYVGPASSSDQIGWVGFGTSSPEAFVHIKNINPGYANTYTMKVDDVNNSNGLSISSGHSTDVNGGDLGVILLCKTNDNHDVLRVRSSGKTYAREIVVNLNNAWPDYVFDESYKLNDLESVKTYIEQNNHLPGVPSANEVAKEGINVAEMDAILLKKVEELTLYMLELKKENEELKKYIDSKLNK